MSEENIDLNNDGKVTKTEQEVYEQRAVNRRRMAWVSLFAMIASAIAVMFFVPESRLNQLDGLLEIYWVALGSVVGAYVGISTWMSRKD
jgi:cytochrome bd-type quinol oxidase subunit 2